MPKSTYPADTLQEIIKEMSTEKKDQLVNVFRGARDNFQDEKNKKYFERKESVNDYILRGVRLLYEQADDTDEARNFRLFMRNNSIALLSAGNTINMKVTNNDTGFTEVLAFRNKKGSRLGSEMMQRLTDNEVIAPILQQREYDGRYCLSVIEYYPKGSLDKLFENPSLGQDERYLLCSGYMQDMIKTFQYLQKKEILFPDAKAPNWMIGHNKKLIITDTKSLTGLSEIRELKEPTKLTRTPEYNPPELDKSIQPGDKIHIEKTHAYILGANIYDCLTGRQPPTPPFRDKDFDKPIFKGHIGGLYQDLIKNLIPENPEDRMGLDDAMRRLKHIHENQRVTRISGDSRKAVRGDYNETKRQRSPISEKSNSVVSDKSNSENSNSQSSESREQSYKKKLQALRESRKKPNPAEKIGVIKQYIENNTFIVEDGFWGMGGKSMKLNGVDVRLPTNVHKIYQNIIQYELSVENKEGTLREKAAFSLLGNIEETATKAYHDTTSGRDEQTQQFYGAIITFCQKNETFLELEGADNQHAARGPRR